MPLGTYIRWRVFGDSIPANRTRERRPVKDGTALGRVIGLLGQARLASNLNQLAKAANSGSLPVTPETEAELVQACAMIRQMRDDLIAAPGLRESAHDP